MKYSCYQECSLIHGLVCLLGFWLRNASLVKADNPISDGIVFVFFTLLDAYENYKDYKGSSDPWLT